MLPSKQFNPLVVSTFPIVSVLRFKPIIIGGRTDNASVSFCSLHDHGFLRDMLVRMMKIMLLVCYRNIT